MRKLFVLCLVVFILGCISSVYQETPSSTQKPVTKESTNQKPIKASTSTTMLSSNRSKLNHFTVIVQSLFELNGAGTNVDSIAFWEAPDPRDTLMFVTGKDNKVVEVWKYPFQGNELEHMEFNNTPNGVVVDQVTDELYVGEFTKGEVSAYSLPQLSPINRFGGGVIGSAETNLDILYLEDDSRRIYVSDSRNVYAFDPSDNQLILTINPPVTSIETVLADDFYQIIYIPEEQGGAGISPGVHSYHPNGTKFMKERRNVFGNENIFNADEEGILLYTCPSDGLTDDGTGYIIVSDQTLPLTEFEIFDRVSWEYLGQLKIKGVKNTDGIASTQKALPDYPLGLFAAVDNDRTVALVGWDKILTTTGLGCN